MGDDSFPTPFMGKVVLGRFMSAENTTLSCIPIKGTVVNESQMHGNVAHIMSRANRRMYPEDRIYRVRFKLEQPGITRLNVYTLKPTWRVMNALRLAKEAWLNNTEDEFRAIPKGLRPKWRTFRTYGPLGNSPHLYGLTFQVDPTTNNVVSSVQTSGEFDISRVVTSGGAEKWMTLSNNVLGGQLGIFDEYAQGRPVVAPTPDAISTSNVGNVAYDELQDDIDSEIIDDIADEGNLPPYNAVVPHGDMLTATSITVDGDSNMISWIDVPTGWFILNTPTQDEDLEGSSVCMHVKETPTGLWSKPIGKTIKQKDGTYKVVNP